MKTKENIIKYNINISNKNEKNNAKKSIKKIFYKTNPCGISLIVLVITIIVIIILATAIILTLNKNNPIEDANRARYEIDRDIMQSIFTNTVAKIMAKNAGIIEINPCELNNVKSGVNSTVGETTYKLNNPEKSENVNGKIIFDNKENTETEYYTGRKLPIYKAGETIWSVDSQGILKLQIRDEKYEENKEEEKNKPTEEEVKIGKEEYDNLISRLENLENKSNELEKKTNGIEKVNLMNNPINIPVSSTWLEKSLSDINLSDSIENYKYLEVCSEISYVNSINTSCFQTTNLISTDQIKYHNSNTTSWGNGSLFPLNNNVAKYNYGVYAWFKNNKVLHIGISYTNDSSQKYYFRIKSIKGIK